MEAVNRYHLPTYKWIFPWLPYVAVVRIQRVQKHEKKGNRLHAHLSYVQQKQTGRREETVFPGRETDLRTHG